MANGKTDPSKTAPQAKTPDGSDLQGKAYSAAQDADRTPPTPVDPPEPSDPRYSRAFGSPNGEATLKSGDGPSTLAEEEVSPFVAVTPGDVVVQACKGLGFTVRDTSKDEAKKVRLGMTFQVLREGQVAAICRIAGDAGVGLEGGFGWQHVNANLGTKLSSEFAGLQPGDTLHFLDSDDPKTNLGNNPFERAKGTVGV